MIAIPHWVSFPRQRFVSDLVSPARAPFREIVTAATLSYDRGQIYGP